MIESAKWLADAKARLAVSPTSRRRAGSVAGRVEALRPEIEAARAAGKTWKQIAEDLSNGEELNPDAVRIAFNRLTKAQGTPAAPAKDATTKPAAALKRLDTPKPVDRPVPINSAKPVHQPGETSLPEHGLLAGMFAPLLDARDTRGRGSNRTSDEEGRP